MSTESGAENGPNSFSQFASDLNASPDELVRLLKTYNGGLAGAQRISDRAIENMRHKGISLRRSLTREWLAGFVRSLRVENDDMGFGETSELIKGLTQSGANLSVPDVAPPDLVFHDVKKFGVAISEVQNNNAMLETSRVDLAGHYIVARETTRADRFRYYEEPLFLGLPEEESWMLTHRSGIARGFAVPSNGMLTVVLHHEHRMRGTGVIVLMIASDDIVNGDAYSTGLVMRLSDTQARPTASRIVLRRAKDQDEIDAWTSLVQSEGSVSARDVGHYVRELDDGDSMQEKYRALETGFSLKTPELADWPDILKKVGLVGDD